MNKIRILYTRIYVCFLRLMGRNIIVGKNTVIDFHAHIVVGKGKIIIGDKCYIGPWAVLNAHDGTISLGNNVSVNYFSVLYGHGNLSIGNNSRIATHATIIPNEHNYACKNTLIRKQGNKSTGIIIGEDVWLGANVTILDGSILQDGCVIGANSLVKGTVESHAVYAGTPAKKIGSRA